MATVNRSYETPTVDESQIDHGYVRLDEHLMKAIRVGSYGGPIKWMDVERPVLPHIADDIVQTMSEYLREDKNVAVAGMVILQVAAVGLSLADNLSLHGKY